MSPPEPVLGAWGNVSFYSFSGQTLGLEGVTGGKPGSVGAGIGPLEGGKDNIGVARGSGGGMVHSGHQGNVGAWSTVVLNTPGPPRGIVVPLVLLVSSDSL